jgi:RNA polymerase-binding transcription factor DksA
MSVSRQRRANPKAKGTARGLVGDAQPTEGINPKWRAHYRRLLELHDYLLRQRQGKFKDATAEQPSFSMHMADAGTDSYDRDLALGMLSHEQDALYEVEDALNRIRNGTYGTCELTGRKIPAARLEAVPWTRFTAPAEKSLEKTGDVQRAQLGARETVRHQEAASEPEEES